jgi:hypothetical protein
VNHECDEPESVSIDLEAERRELEAARWESFEEGTGEVVLWGTPRVVSYTRRGRP